MHVAGLFNIRYVHEGCQSTRCEYKEISRPVTKGCAKPCVEGMALSPRIGELKCYPNLNLGLNHSKQDAIKGRKTQYLRALDGDIGGGLIAMSYDESNQVCNRFHMDPI